MGSRVPCRGAGSICLYSGTVEWGEFVNAVNALETGSTRRGYGCQASEVESGKAEMASSITNHLAQVIKTELTDPNGYKAAFLGIAVTALRTILAGLTIAHVALISTNTTCSATRLIFSGDGATISSIA